MIAALLLGCGAAIVFSVGLLLSAPATRRAGTARTMLWSSAAAATMATVAAALGRPPSGAAGEWGLVLLAGAAYCGGTGLMLAAFNAGHVSLVTPIVACDGAVGSLLAAATGARIGAIAAVAVAVMVTAIVLVARSASAQQDTAAGRFGPAQLRPLGQTVALAAGSAACYGFVFFASGHVHGIPPLWVAAISRAVPSLCALIVCAWLRKLAPPISTWRWIIGYGLLDGLGYVLYILAARHDRVIAPVAASQYAALAAIGGIVLLRERVSRSQLGGLLVLVIAAAVIVIAGRG